MTSRTYTGTTATLSYDTQDHLTEWNAGATSQEWYLYDGAGQRVLRRSTNSTTTSLTVYAFGQEEHSYTSTGSNQGNTYYYTLDGHLPGKSDGRSTTFYQTDLLGSVVADLSNTAGSAAVLGNAVYGPYGRQRYHQGMHGTPKGFTGQYNDSLTGLDYYIARYYDPAVGVFLSADAAQGNAQGMNPYAYVNGNPETDTDPSGQYFSPAFRLANGLDASGGPSDPAPIVSTRVFSPAFRLANGLDGSMLSYRVSGGHRVRTVFYSGAVHRNVVHRSVPRVVHHASISMTRDSLTSCGTPGPSQALCGNWGVHYAVYLSTGGQLALPGSWCLDCGFGGGSNNSGGSGSSYDLLASDTEGGALGEADAGGAGGDLPEQAQARAVEIRDIMVKNNGWWFRKEATVGVAYMQDSEGVVRRYTAVNEGALKKWGSAVHNLLDPGE